MAPGRSTRVDLNKSSDSTLAKRSRNETIKFDQEGNKKSAQVVQSGEIVHPCEAGCQGFVHDKFSPSSKMGETF